jgi:hypothetical protein
MMLDILGGYCSEKEEVSKCIRISISFIVINSLTQMRTVDEQIGLSIGWGKRQPVQPEEAPMVIHYSSSSPGNRGYKTSRQH